MGHDSYFPLIRRHHKVLYNFISSNVLDPDRIEDHRLPKQLSGCGEIVRRTLFGRGTQPEEVWLDI